MFFRISVMAALLMSGTSLFAQYKSYSLWRPTNDASVNYRWYVDDLTPPACIVQLDVTDQGKALPKVVISYRTRSGRMILSGVHMMLSPRNGPERMIVGCTFIDKVAVVNDPWIPSIIAGRVRGGANDGSQNAR